MKSSAIAQTEANVVVVGGRGEGRRGCGRSPQPAATAGATFACRATIAEPAGRGIADRVRERVPEKSDNTPLFSRHTS